MHLLYHILLLIICFDTFIHCRGGGGRGGGGRARSGRVGGGAGKYLYFFILNFVSLKILINI
jgi:hypothetical protein